MEKRKIEMYDDGYSHSDMMKRLTAAASALLFCGSLTACRHNSPSPDEKIMGNMVYEPPVSDSDVSPSDISSDDALSIMGEEQYFPVEDESSGNDYDGNMTVAPSEGY